MFRNDIAFCRSRLEQCEWYLSQPERVKNALVNMCFNLGFQGLLTFHKMIEALKNEDYEKAAQEALDSKWANQVGERANDVAQMIQGAKSL